MVTIPTIYGDDWGMVHYVVPTLSRVYSCMVNIYLQYWVVFLWADVGKYSSTTVRIWVYIYDAGVCDDN